MTIFSLFQPASFNRFQMSDIVKFGENISIIQKRATFEKISILEVYYRWQASGGRKCAVSCRIFSGLPVGTLNVARIIIRLSTANLLSGMQGESF